MTRINNLPGLENLGVHHIHPRRDYEGDLDEYPDDLLVTLCEKCHSKTGLQSGKMQYPINARGKEAKLDRIQSPKYRQASFDDYDE